MASVIHTEHSPPHLLDVFTCTHIVLIVICKSCMSSYSFRPLQVNAARLAQQSPFACFNGKETIGTEHQQLLSFSSLTTRITCSLQQGWRKRQVCATLASFFSVRGNKRCIGNGVWGTTTSLSLPTCCLRQPVHPPWNFPASFVASVLLNFAI